MQPFMSYKSSHTRSRERRHLALAIASVAILLLLAGFTLDAQGFEFYEEDEHGNINQRNIGVYKSNSLVRGRASDVKVEKQTRMLPAFSRLHLKVPVTLVYQESGPVRVEIEATKAAHRALKLSVDSGVLLIESTDVLLESSPTLHVYGKHLEAVSIDSAADARFENISVNQFELRVRAAADISVSGRARACTLYSQSASDIDLSALYCDQLKLSAFGAADIQLQVKDSVEGRAQGAGDVIVYGQPKRRELKAMGAYDIEYL